MVLCSIAHTDLFRSKTTFYTESTTAYLMPPERSVDIENQIDFFTAEFFIGK
jgi:CMP-N-acetylneuraminic acid synthetase